MDIKVRIRVKQTLWSKFMWKTIMVLGSLNLMSLETVVKIANFTLRNGAFKYKAVGVSDKWEKLTITDELVVG